MTRVCFILSFSKSLLIPESANFVVFGWLGCQGKLSMLLPVYNCLKVKSACHACDTRASLLGCHWSHVAAGYVQNVHPIL